MDALDGYAEESVKCAARGIFRNRGISPVAGDRVLVETGENAEPVISEIRGRKNFLVRPPLANLDKIVLVNSVAEPAPPPQNQAASRCNNTGGGTRASQHGHWDTGTAGILRRRYAAHY